MSLSFLKRKDENGGNMSIEKEVSHEEEVSLPEHDGGLVHGELCLAIDSILRQRRGNGYLLLTGGRLRQSSRRYCRC